MNYYKQSEPEIKYIPIIQPQNTNTNTNNTSKKTEDPEQTVNIDIINNKQHNIHLDPLIKFDHDALNDEFTPPFRRSYYDENNYRFDHHGRSLHPIYTRGRPTSYRKIGLLISQNVSTSDPFKLLIMMGRRSFGNREYEYHAISPSADQRLKFYIDTKGKEINNGDIVNIEELEGHSYKFKEDIDLSPRYDPYIV